MKLKKAMREYARAVDELAYVTNLLALTRGESNEFLMEWRNDARREKKRTVRQMSAVAHALQYRGANKIAYEQPVLLATKRDQLYVYIARLAWETSEIRDKMLSPCSASIKDEVEKGARSGTLFERTLGWRSDADFYANRVLAGAVRDRYPLDDYAELGVYMFKQEWKDKHFVSIVASGTIEECISIDEHANCSE